MTKAALKKPAKGSCLAGRGLPGKRVVAYFKLQHQILKITRHILFTLYSFVMRLLRQRFLHNLKEGPHYAFF
jgi:hypothetical protein